VPAIRAEADAPNTRNELPIKVTEYDAEVGTFARMLEEIEGALYVKITEVLEDKMPAVTAAKDESKCPAALLHRTLESEIQKAA
jgi:hypothetical protein